MFMAMQCEAVVLKRATIHKSDSNEKRNEAINRNVKEEKLFTKMNWKIVQKWSRANEWGQLDTHSSLFEYFSA